MYTQVQIIVYNLNFGCISTFIHFWRFFFKRSTLELEKYHSNSDSQYACLN